MASKILYILYQSNSFDLASIFKQIIQQPSVFLGTVVYDLKQQIANMRSSIARFATPSNSPPATRPAAASRILAGARLALISVIILCGARSLPRNF